MEYVKWLRTLVGKNRIIVAATAVVIMNEKNEILLQLRDDFKNWGLPGGLMNLGESLLECAIREVFEETGLKIDNLKLYGIFSGEKFEAQYPNGDLTAPIIIGFYTKHYSGNFVKSDESLDLQFFNLDSLPKDMNPFHNEFVLGFKKFSADKNKDFILG
ncbi:MAG: NUDIX domain-containing protein [Oligoflexia bacterium]|nr:NUDIX domain-containing protein [Oligoflexia bacterium]